MNFTFKQNPLLSWIFSLNYRNIRGARGDGIYTGDEFIPVYGTSTVTAANLAGAGYSVFDIGISIRRKF